MRRLYFFQLSLFILILTISNSLFAQAGSPEALPAQIYLKLEPPFVINVEDGEVIRFLQVDAELQFSDPVAQPMIEKHLPAIRHAMVMLLSGQPTKTVKTAKGKEDLRVAALKKVQKIMTDNTGKPIVEGLYFTTFIVQ